MQSVDGDHPTTCPSLAAESRAAWVQRLRIGYAVAVTDRLSGHRPTGWETDFRTVNGVKNGRNLPDVLGGVLPTHLLRKALCDPVR